MIIAELSREAEMLIRTEGCENHSQGQRIVGEKIQSYHEAATRKHKGFSEIISPVIKPNVKTRVKRYAELIRNEV